MNAEQPMHTDGTATTKNMPAVEPRTGDPSAKHPDRRDRRVYVWWGVGLGFLLVLGLFCWLVVGPVLTLRTITGEMVSSGAIPDRAIQRMGGRRQAAFAIRVYFSLPRRYSPNRWEACWLLGRCDRYAVGAVRLALHDDDPDVRRTALLLASHLDPFMAPLAPDIVPLLQDPNPAIRAAAASDIGQAARNSFGPSTVAGTWSCRIGGSNPKRRHEPRGAFPFLDLDKTASPAKGGGRQPWMAPAVATLIQLLDDSDLGVQLDAMSALAGLRQEAAPATEALTRVLESTNSDADLRAQAAGALAAIGPGASAAVPALLKRFADPFENVRGNAGIAVMAIAHDRPDLLEVLKPLIADRNSGVRAAMARALFEVRGQEGLGLRTLTAMLAEADPQAREAAVNQLAGIIPRAPGALATIERISAEDPSPKVREAALWGLASRREMAPEVAPVIARALADKDAAVRHVAACALAALKDHGAVPPLLDELKDSDALGRSFAAQLLGNLGDPRAIEPLKDLLTDPDSRVRRDAAEALKKLRGDAK